MTKMDRPENDFLYIVLANGGRLHLPERRWRHMRR